MAACWIAAGGCVDNQTDSAATEPTIQDEVRRLESRGHEPSEPYDVSGGGISDFDEDAFRRDLDSVFGP